ncbi:uncharacterized protein LOC102807859 [Saccoglossus kowalevskii]|uniref:Uncharacterized protein LOC102807859 n=1 Tax=Saccoglossus kowalevskii TaxID=10224 RepID=A0ABM0MUU9_SACKO|nr:PREDICTED: uncharacterized protein LOC102807859 [Saccoglossus kowalevskii]
MARVDHFLDFLCSLSEEIGRDDIITMVGLTAALEEPIGKNAREQLENKKAYALFQKLCETGHLTKNNSKTLTYLLTKANLLALVTQVEVRFRMGFDVEVTPEQLKAKVDLEEKNKKNKKEQPDIVKNH